VRNTTRLFARGGGNRSERYGRRSKKNKKRRKTREWRADGEKGILLNGKRGCRQTDATDIVEGGGEDANERRESN
jgi:hypothetical protein